MKNLKILLLILMLSTKAGAQPDICGLSLSKNYKQAINELVIGYVTLEKMRIDGEESAAQLSLEKELNLVVRELIELLGADEFEKHFTAAKLKNAEELKKENQQTRTRREETVTREKDFIQPNPFTLLYALDDASNVLITPDSESFVYHTEKAIRVHKALTGELVSLIDINLQHIDRVHDVAVSPDSQLFATVASLKDDFGVPSLFVWSLKTGELLQNIKCTDKLMRWVGFSPDSRRVLSLSQFGHVAILNVKSGKYGVKFQTTDGLMVQRRFEYSPDGAYIITAIAMGAKDRSTVEIWDAKTGLSTSRIFKNSLGITKTIWHPDGTKILLYDELSHNVKVWHLQSNKIVNLNKEAFTPAWSEDGKKVITADRLGVVREWSPTTGRYKVKFSLGVKRLASISWFLNAGVLFGTDSDGNFMLWDSKTGILLENMGVLKYVVKLSLDAKFLTIGSWGTKPVLTQVLTRKAENTIE